jgi:DNA-binding LytR/AlgR family response regulator
MLSTPVPGVETNRLRVLVVEDEWIARNYLVELLEGSGQAEVVGAVGDADAARDTLRSAPLGLHIDAVFVDIELGDKRGERAGLELVRELCELPQAPMTVLATAFDEHAVEAYQLGVADYLLKPFSEDRVEQCLRRLFARSPQSSPTSPTRIVARRRRSLVFLPREEIWAFEASERLTFVHTPHGRFDLDLSLAAIEASFGKDFVRVHRSWLVNASFVKELERDGSETWLFVGASLREEARGVRVPVARERAAQVRSVLLEHTTGLRRV